MDTPATVQAILTGWTNKTAEQQIALLHSESRLVAVAAHLARLLANSVEKPEAQTQIEDLAPGVSYRTTSGRITLPFPATAEEVEGWLVASALNEAKGRNDLTRECVFAGMVGRTISAIEQKFALEYTFGNRTKVAVNASGVPQYPKGDARRLLALAAVIEASHRPSLARIKAITGIAVGGVRKAFAALAEQFGISIAKVGRGYAVLSWGEMISRGAALALVNLNQTQGV